MIPYILDIVFAGLILFFVIRGTVRGFFKAVIRFFRFLIAALAAHFLGETVASFLSEKFFAERIQKAVYEKIEGIYQNATASFDPEKILSAFPKFLLPES